jgi:hypothetical protein
MARNLFPREFRIPKGAIKVSDKYSDAVAYMWTNALGHPCYMVFYGKQSKPVAHYRARNEAERAKAIVHAFVNRAAWCARKAAYRAERKAWVNNYKVGEIVNTCWGYDQTNREFYEIVAVKGKHVTLRQIGITSYATGWAQERVSPLAGSFVGEPFTRLAQECGIKIGKHSHTYARRTSYSEAVPGVKVYEAGHTSSYA